MGINQWIYTKSCIYTAQKWTILHNWPSLRTASSYCIMKILQCGLPVQRNWTSNSRPDGKRQPISSMYCTRMNYNIEITLDSIWLLSPTAYEMLAALLWTFPKVNYTEELNLNYTVSIHIKYTPIREWTITYRSFWILLDSHHFPDWIPHI